jgi:serine/threonine protein kinase
LSSHTAYSGFKADIFALGVILFLLVNGFPPFYKFATNSDPYYKFFAEKKENVYWSCLKRKFQLNFDNDFIDLINKMLAANDADRITIKEVLAHPWL